MAMIYNAFKERTKLELVDANSPILLKVRGVLPEGMGARAPRVGVGWRNDLADKA